MNVGVTCLTYLFLIVQVLVASFLLQPFILLLIYALGRLFGVKQRSVIADTVKKNYQFGIIVTAHREITFIPPIVDSLLKQTYPFFNVYIVADDCDTSSLTFSDPRIHILRPETPLNDKTKSILYALERFDTKDEVLVIFDPDNLVHPKFLQVANAWYNRGYRAVQGNLFSKNLD